jgi:DNA-binding response OmpR family regulator
MPAIVYWSMAGGADPTRILVVDDEANLVELVQGYLEREGYQVLTASDGAAALAIAREAQPDLIVLDLMLPGIDGLEVCRRIRQFSDAYIVMLTARAEEVDKVVGLSVGADDYLTKPFSPRELVARVQAMLRRPRATSQTEVDAPEPLTFGDLTIDTARHTVLRRGEPIVLTARELAILARTGHPGAAGGAPWPRLYARTTARTTVGQRLLRRPCGGRARGEPAPQTRGRPGTAAMGPDRARRRLPTR